MLATQLGYVGQMGSLSVTLGAAQTLTSINPTLTSATCTVSGQVQDSSASTNLKGVQLMFSSSGNYFALAMSDGNGNSTITVRKLAAIVVES